jgi:hypothetical protein
MFQGSFIRCLPSVAQTTSKRKVALRLSRSHSTIFAPLDIDYVQSCCSVARIAMRRPQTPFLAANSASGSFRNSIQLPPTQPLNLLHRQFQNLRNHLILTPHRDHIPSDFFRSVFYNHLELSSTSLLLEPPLFSRISFSLSPEGVVFDIYKFHGRSDSICNKDTKLQGKMLQVAFSETNMQCLYQHRRPLRSHAVACPVEVTSRAAAGRIPPHFPPQKVFQASAAAPKIAALFPCRFDSSILVRPR